MGTYEELLAQRKILEQQIAVAHKAAAARALDEVHALVAKFGFTAQQVFPWKPAPQKAPAKYRDPVTGATWSGKGRVPKWIAGKERGAFEV